MQIPIIPIINKRVAHQEWLGPIACGWLELESVVVVVVLVVVVWWWCGGGMVVVWGKTFGPIREPWFRR